jgi:hypothetical protein
MYERLPRAANAERYANYFSGRTETLLPATAIPE